MEIENIRKSIKQLRKAKGLTQKDMAAKLFIDERTYSKIERGEQKSMDIRFILSVAQILEMDPLSLLKRSFGTVETVELVPEDAAEFAGSVGLQQLLETMTELNHLKQEFKDLIGQQKQILETLKIYTV